MPYVNGKKAVFLDRDGTLIEDGPYLSDPGQIRFLDGAVDALKRLKQHGFLLVLITNQSGVGRGHFSEETLRAIHARLQSSLKKEGVALDAIYYCPHSPDAGCKCRKPKPLLFQTAIRDFSINPLASYAVGDKEEDAIAAKQVGCKTILAGCDASRGAARVDFLCKDLAATADWILEKG